MAVKIPDLNLADLFDRATVGRKAGTPVEVDPVVTAFVARVIGAGGYGELPPIPAEQVADVKAQIRSATLAAGKGATIRQIPMGDGDDGMVLTVSIGDRRGPKSAEVNGSIDPGVEVG